MVLPVLQRGTRGHASVARLGLRAHEEPRAGVVPGGRLGQEMALESSLELLVEPLVGVRIICWVLKLQVPIEAPWVEVMKVHSQNLDF